MASLSNAASVPSTNTTMNLALVVPSKGLLYGDSGTVTTSKKMDDAIFAALKGAYINHPAHTQLMEGNTSQIKSEVDTILGTMFKDAAVEPLVSTLTKDNDGLEFLSKLQAQTTWAAGLDFTPFAVLFRTLAKAHKKWVQGAGVDFLLLRTDYSKTSVEVDSFLKLIGDDKWAGLDAEVQLLETTS
ncbi:hypothetical protein PG993_004673 [Apiospora rasikravindrae]|uniref:Uncharacterized protein n=1 Tax=Apiospora rasikravindrae TaxID=990691 RepID=A0ABR1TDF0_9PEZI